MAREMAAVPLQPMSVDIASVWNESSSAGNLNGDNIDLDFANKHMTKGVHQVRSNCCDALLEIVFSAEKKIYFLCQKCNREVKLNPIKFGPPESEKEPEKPEKVEKPEPVSRQKEFDLEYTD